MHIQNLSFFGLNFRIKKHTDIIEKKKTKHKPNLTSKLEVL